MSNAEAALSRTIDTLMDRIEALRDENSRLRIELFNASREIGELRGERAEPKTSAAETLRRNEERKRRRDALLRLANLDGPQ